MCPQFGGAGGHDEDAASSCPSGGGAVRVGRISPNRLRIVQLGSRQRRKTKKVVKRERNSGLPPARFSQFCHGEQNCARGGAQCLSLC
jgi:hypothetical protein